MREEVPQNTIDILCIGEMKSGKSFFLRGFTEDCTPTNAYLPYHIYVKNINNSIVYFHELSEV